MNINEKAAYIKGLFEGSDFDKNSKEVTIISELIALETKMAEKISKLEKENAELREYIEEIDEDLGAVEEELYFDDEDYDDDVEQEDDIDSDDDVNEDYYELECPNCGETICFDDSIDIDSLVCPACGEKINDVELCDLDCDSCDSKDCE